MSWQYRLVRHQDDETLDGRNEFFQIHEVYFYDDDGKYRAMTENGVKVYGDDIEEVQHVLDLMKEAFSRTIIDFDGDKSNVKAE